MSKPMTWLLAGAALTLSAGALTAGAALAQTSQAAQQQATQDSAAAAKSDTGSDREERRGMRVYHQDDHRHVRVSRSEHLSDVLQLRPDQEPALKAFLDATRSERGHRDHMVKFERDSDRTTLQRLDDMQARLAAQQAETNRKIAAIKTFYSQLDASQKKAFDAMPMLMFSGPSFGPQLIPVGHPMPPRPPAPPAPPRL